MGDEPKPILKFAPLRSLIDAGFWHKLSRLKLVHWGLDESPIPITGFFAPCARSQISNNLTLLSESFPSDTSGPPSSSNSGLVNRNRCPAPGTLYNMNTIEGYASLDGQRLLKEEAQKIWVDIQNGEIERDCTKLLRFCVISFADLKKWEFHHAVAFPTFVLQPPATVVDLKPASKWFSLEEAKSVSAACNEWRNSSTTTGVPFFLVTIASTSLARVRHLNEWDACQQDSEKILFGFYDPCHLPNCPGWPLRNFLAFLYSRWNMTTVHFFCYRENRGFADMGLSLVGEARISQQGTVPGWKDHNHIPQVVGWEINNGKRERFIDLSASLDPKRLAESSAELNLLLMKWRVFSKLDIDLLYSTKCLLIGAGTLGCHVARNLMAWGIRNITLVDSGKVAISNPLRQNLYTINDVGQDKATAAANSLKSIHHSVNAKGVVMAIPMPGHPVSSTEEKEKVLDDCRQLQELVMSHDVVFLLTDTRESRWLPTLLCANANKVAINAALGFESYLVMRHGAGPDSSISEVADALASDLNNLSMGDKDRMQRLGCYFCNDVVAPINSTSNRTLDQQCTVTRPGLAGIASGYAVEQLVGLLHHPLRINAPPEIESGNSDSLGILAHQIRGSLSQLTQMSLVGHASNSCTACSKIVVTEFQNNSMDFILNVIKHPTYLEDLTGLTELQKSANLFQSNWDVDEDLDDDEFVEL